MEHLRFDGFLGTRASLMLDVVFLAMFAVLVILAVSIYLVRNRRHYLWHKRIQLILGFVLLVTVTLFEADMRINGWMDRAARFEILWADAIAPLALVDDVSKATAPGRGARLGLHVAGGTPVFRRDDCLLWIGVIVQALRRFPKPPAPNEYSPQHKFWAWLAAIDMGFTALTGWIFYVLAFVA